MIDDTNDNVTYDTERESMRCIADVIHTIREYFKAYLVSVSTSTEGQWFITLQLLEEEDVINVYTILLPPEYFLMDIQTFTDYVILELQLEINGTISYSIN